MASPSAGETGRSFGRGRRVLATRDFRAAYAFRARASDGRLVLYARPRDGGGPTRLGLSVGRKFGKAVARNRIKRLVREAFRLARAGWPEGYDLIVVPLAAGMSQTDVAASLGRLVPEAIRRARRKASQPPARSASAGSDASS